MIGQLAVGPVTRFVSAAGMRSSSGPDPWNRELLKTVDDKLRNDVQYFTVERSLKKVLAVWIGFPRSVDDSREGRFVLRGEERPEDSRADPSRDRHRPMDGDALALRHCAGVFEGIHAGLVHSEKTVQTDSASPSLSL